MAIITDITLQSKNIDRVNLFVDGKFYAGVSRIAVYNHKLAVGTEIDESILDKVIFDSDKDKAFDYALTYISRYTPTEKILKNKLYEKGYGKMIVEYTLDKCKKYGYIDDKEYARSYVSLNSAVKGKNRLRAELKAKGVADAYIDKALEGLKQGATCSEVAKKHSKNADVHDPKYRAKLIRFLQYRGYEWEDISQALSVLKIVDDGFEGNGE